MLTDDSNANDNDQNVSVALVSGFIYNLVSNQNVCSKGDMVPCSSNSLNSDYMIQSSSMAGFSGFFFKFKIKQIK